MPSGEFSKELAEVSKRGCLRVQGADAFLIAVPKTNLAYTRKVQSVRFTLRFFSVLGCCLAKHEEGKNRIALPLFPWNETGY